MSKGEGKHCAILTLQCLLYKSSYVLLGNTIIYNYICYIYSTVGRSIADIYDLRQHIYRGAKRRGKYAAKVVYSGYGPTYRIIYTIYIYIIPINIE